MQIRKVVWNLFHINNACIIVVLHAYLNLFYILIDGYNYDSDKTAKEKVFHSNVYRLPLAVSAN